MAVPLDRGVVLDALRSQDGPTLTAYFDGLSMASKSQFQPHPLTCEAAETVCREVDHTHVLRYVLREEGRITGYFILDPDISVHESRRYLKRLIVLEQGKDFIFALSLADLCQSHGMASRAMPHLICAAMARGARSLVLMGGVQATNVPAMAFYERWGFVRHGGFQTSMFNHDMRLALNRNGWDAAGPTGGPVSGANGRARISPRQDGQACPRG